MIYIANTNFLCVSVCLRCTDQSVDNKNNWWLEKLAYRTACSLHCHDFQATHTWMNKNETRGPQMLLPPSSSSTHTERDEKLALLACLFVCLSQKSMRPGGDGVQAGAGGGVKPQKTKGKKKPTNNRVLSESINGKKLGPGKPGGPTACCCCCCGLSQVWTTRRGRGGAMNRYWTSFYTKKDGNWRDPDPTKTQQQ